MQWEANEQDERSSQAESMTMQWEASGKDEGSSQAESMNMHWEASGQEEGPSQAEPEDEKPTPAEQEAMLKEWEESWHKRISGYQADEVDAQWKASTTYTAMLQLNRDFLLGRLPCTPYHNGAIDSETTPLLKGLLRLHDYGLLTVESQPSKYTEPHFRPAFDRRYSSAGWYEFRQRAFVEFLMPTDGSIPLEQVRHFCLSLAEYPDIHARIGAGLSYIIKYDDSSSPQATWKASQPLSDERWVSSSSRKRDLRSIPWKTYTSAPKKTNEEYWLDFLPELVTLTRPLVIMVFLKSWEINLDLEALIQELAKSAGIRDSFREPDGHEQLAAGS